MRGNGEGKRGEWPRDIKNGDKWEGRGERGRFSRCKGDYKREEKKKEEEIKGKIPRSQKGERVCGGYSGGKAECIAMVLKRRILLLAALRKSIDFITNFLALDSH